MRFCFEYISTVEVRNCLKQLQPKKALAYDDFPPNMIKNCADCLAQLLSYFNYLSLSTRILRINGRPRKWFR